MDSKPFASESRVFIKEEEEFNWNEEEVTEDNVLETCNMFMMKEQNSLNLKDPLSIDVASESKVFIKEESESYCNKEETDSVLETCNMVIIKEQNSQTLKDPLSIDVTGVIFCGYKCFYCHEKCQGKEDLLKHLCETHEDIPMVFDSFPFLYKCCFCSGRCRTEFDLHKHVVEAHYPIILGDSFRNTSNPSCEVKLNHHVPNNPASSLEIAYHKNATFSSCGLNKNVPTQFPKPTKTYRRRSQKKHLSPAAISNYSSQNCEKPEEVTNEDSSPRILSNLTNYFYTCYYCKGRSSCKKDLELHIIQTHLPYLGNDNPMPPISKSTPRVPGARAKSQTQTKKNFYHCSYCAYSATRNCMVRDHVSAKHTFEKPFNCKLCDYRSSSKGLILGHMKTKHAEKQFKCDQCDYRASQPCKLKYHQQAKHSELKNYNCPYCDYRAAHAGGIRRHVALQHQKYQTFHCPYCVYITRHASVLQTHFTAKHTQERPFRCQECDYGSVTSRSLKLHMMTHHDYERPFPCEHCSYKAVSSNSLKKHFESKHTPLKQYTCEHCDYKSSRLLVLRKHNQAKHLGEKPFQCFHCGYASAWFGNLKIHIRSLHNKDPWHKCAYCCFRSLVPNGLKSHMKKKHYFNGALQPGLKPRRGPGRPRRASADGKACIINKPQGRPSISEKLSKSKKKKKNP